MSQFDNTPFTSGPLKGEPRGFRCTCGADCDLKSETCSGNVKVVGFEQGRPQSEGTLHACRIHAGDVLKSGAIAFPYSDGDWELPGPQRATEA